MADKIIQPDNWEIQDVGTSLNVYPSKPDISNWGVKNNEIDTGTIVSQELEIGNLEEKIRLPSGGLLKSSNFVSGSKGWQIDGDGNAEFNTGNFRGTVTASAVIVTTGADTVVLNAEFGASKVISTIPDIQPATIKPIIAGGSDGYLAVNMTDTNIFYRYKVTTYGGLILAPTGVNAYETVTGNIRGMCNLGSYWYITTSTPAVRRYTIADGTITDMTISGTPPTVYGNIVSDGTYLYILDGGDKPSAAASATVRKYSVSGTVMTFVSTITLSDLAVCLGCDGSNFFFTTPSSGATDNLYLKKDTLEGVNVLKWKLPGAVNISYSWTQLKTTSGNLTYYIYLCKTSGGHYFYQINLFNMVT